MQRKKRDMAKSKIERLTEKFESGDYDIDSLPDVTFSVSKNAKSLRMVPVKRSIIEDLERLAAEKKTTVEKLMEFWLRQNLRKAKAA